MAKEELVQKMMEYPSRLQMSMLGPVKDIAASIPDGDKEVRIIGYVMGEARGVSYRNNPNDTDGLPATALVGVFSGVPAYDAYPGMAAEMASDKRAELASGTCFLPPQAQAAVVGRVTGPGAEVPATPKRGKRIDQLGVAVPIAFEIGIRKSNGPVGYEWVTRGIANVQAKSPIDRMKEALGLSADASMPALVADGTLARIVTNADKGGTPALAAPAKGKAKAKGSKR